MRATIKVLAELIDNPPSPAYTTPINGRTPLDRAKDLHAQARTHWRQKQLSRHEEFVSDVSGRLAADLAEVKDARKAVARLATDLRCGRVSPQEAMETVAGSMKGVDQVLQVVESVERDEEAASTMVDTDPADYETELLERFPAMAEQGTPLLTEEYLRGEAESPFAGGGGR